MRPRLRYVAPIIVCATSLLLINVGSANAAPNVVGMTYDKASSAASNAGLTAVISTSTGTVLQQSQCTVVNQVLRPAAIGQNSNTLLLSLNCNADLATATQAGNSAATPEGQKAKKAQAAEEWRKNSPDGQAWCAINQKQHPDWDWSQLPGCPT